MKLFTLTLLLIVCINNTHAQDNNNSRVELGIGFITGIQTFNLGMGLPNDINYQYANAFHAKVRVIGQHHLKLRYWKYNYHHFNQFAEGIYDVDLDGDFKSIGYEYQFSIWKWGVGTGGIDYYEKSLAYEGYSVVATPFAEYNIDYKGKEKGAMLTVGFGVQLWERIRLIQEIQFAYGNMTLDDEISRANGKSNGIYCNGFGVLSLSIRL